jgi:hypothetical protein
VVAKSLRPREHRRVVRQHGGLAALRREHRAVDAAQARDHAVGRRVAHQVVLARRPRCAATARAPYSLKLPSSHRSAMFSRAVRRPSACRLATACGRGGVEREAPGGPARAAGRRVANRGSGAPLRRCAAGRQRSGASAMASSVSSSSRSCTVSPSPNRRSSHAPAAGAAHTRVPSSSLRGSRPRRQCAPCRRSDQPLDDLGLQGERSSVMAGLCGCACAPDRQRVTRQNHRMAARSSARRNLPRRHARMRALRSPCRHGFRRPRARAAQATRTG